MISKSAQAMFAFQVCVPCYGLGLGLVVYTYTGAGAGAGTGAWAGLSHRDTISTEVDAVILKGEEGHRLGICPQTVPGCRQRVCGVCAMCE